MKDNTENILAIMDYVVEDAKENRHEVVVPEPEPVEEVTIDQLTKNWENSKAKVEEKKKSSVWDTTVKPLDKKEEVYSYFKRKIITGPYLCVILENVFGVPHEMTYEIEDELTKEGFVPGHIRNKERLIADVELWKRVLATCERDKIDGSFYHDAGEILKSRMSSLNIMNAYEEKLEISRGEEAVRNSCRGKRKI